MQFSRFVLVSVVLVTNANSRPSAARLAARPRLSQCRHPDGAPTAPPSRPRAVLTETMESLFCVTTQELAHNAGQVDALAFILVSSDKRRRIYPLNQMPLSSQLRADLESIAAALAVCESILALKTDEQETAEWLENFSRWAD